MEQSRAPPRSKCRTIPPADPARHTRVARAHSRCAHGPHGADHQHRRGLNAPVIVVHSDSCLLSAVCSPTGLPCVPSVCRSPVVAAVRFESRKAGPGTACDSRAADRSARRGPARARIRDLRFLAEQLADADQSLPHAGACSRVRSASTGPDRYRRPHLDWPGARRRVGLAGVPIRLGVSALAFLVRHRTWLASRRCCLLGRPCVASDVGIDRPSRIASA